MFKINEKKREAEEITFLFRKLLMMFQAYLIEKDTNRMVS
jgi:hypothetical protein